MDGIKQVCVRCGKQGAGRTKIMFYRMFENFPSSPVVKEFYCHRCLTVIRVSSIVGIGILLSLLAGLVISFLWIRAKG